jgi:hypothetical protein
MSDWSFATLRVQLAEVTNNFPMWQHAYQAPSDMLNTIAVLPMDATDDYSMPFIRDTFYGCPVTMGAAAYQPQRYALETDKTLGVQVILTNQDQAVLRYTRNLTDPTYSHHCS